MTEEPLPAESDAGVATSPTPEAEAEGDKKDARIQQTVDIREVGPCKKHIKVTVDRASINELMDVKFKDIVKDGQVAGFRPGKAPRRLVVKRFHKQVAEEVKGQLLVASLEQLADEHDIAPLAPPDINPSKLELPLDGPFIYEFEVEVRPEFDLPEYKGLKLKRPVHTFSAEEYAAEERRLLAEDGQVVPKDGPAELGDIVIADITPLDDQGQPLGETREVQLTVEKVLAFRDGMAPNFGEQLAGVKAGETRTIDMVLSSQLANAALRGKKVQLRLNVKDVKSVRMPELDEEYLSKFGVKTPEQLRELIRAVMERRLEYQQQQAARQQVTEYIASKANWQLPEDLLIRQARRALSRRVMEMRSNGISEDEIRRRVRVLEQDILRATEMSLREHFVLQKIAEAEKIEVNEEDLDDEIERIAAQSDESPRRVRARLEKEDMMDALAAEMIERKTLELILQSAEFEDVAIGADSRPDVGMVEQAAYSGEMRDLAAEAGATAAPAEGEAAAQQ